MYTLAECLMADHYDQYLVKQHHHRMVLLKFQNISEVLFKINKIILLK